MGVAAHHRALHAPDPPDTLYALAVGLYAAALLSPAVVMVIGLWLSDDGGVLYVGLLAAVTVITTVVTWLTTRWHGLAERLGSTRLSWGLALLPIVIGVGYFAFSVTVESPSVGPGAIVGLFFGLIGMFLGTVLVGMSQTRFTVAVMDEVTVDCEWAAGWPEKHRKRLRYVSLVAFALLLPAWIAGLLFQRDWLSTAGQVLFAAVIVVWSHGQEQTYRASSAGLERNRPLSRYVFAWDEFTHFTRTDDAVIVHWDSWWRPAIKCATADIDDVEQVADALTAHLPER